MVVVAMVSGSILGAGGTFFSPRWKFYWIAGYFIAIIAVPLGNKYTPTTHGAWSIGSVDSSTFTCPLVQTREQVAVFFDASAPSQ